MSDSGREALRGRRVVVELNGLQMLVLSGLAGVGAQVLAGQSTAASTAATFAFMESLTADEYTDICKKMGKVATESMKDFLS